jgi:hypothetical protein
MKSSLPLGAILRAIYSGERIVGIDKPSTQYVPLREWQRRLGYLNEFLGLVPLAAAVGDPLYNFGNTDFLPVVHVTGEIWSILATAGLLGSPVLSTIASGTR